MNSLNVKSVLALCVPIAESLGYDIVDVETSPKGRILRIFVDRLDGRPVTLDDCAAVSHAVQGPLDAAGVDYERLEVSSPGVDRALTRWQHFVRFVGQRVSVRLNEAVDGRLQLEGELRSADETSFELAGPDAMVRVMYPQVRKARLIGVLNWNGLEKSE